MKKEMRKREMKEVQSRNDYDNDDGKENNDLESAAVAERLRQTGSPRVFQAVAVARKSVCCDLGAAFVRICSGAATQQ